MMTSSPTEDPWQTTAFWGRLSVFLGLLVFLFSVVAVISAVATYRISIEGSKNLLETRAVDIAVNLGFSLERMGLRTDLFPELVRTARWEDLAFLALYDREGTVVLHSNPNLVGRTYADSCVAEVVAQEGPKIHSDTLATGEQVFILDFPLRLHIPGQTSEGEPAEKVWDEAKGEEHAGPHAQAYCLRAAVHQYPAQGIVRRANFQLALVATSLTILWLLSFFFLWIWRRNLRLQDRLHEQERLAALGEVAAVLAHEIRNPLCSIKGFAQYRMVAAKDPGLRKDLEIIVEESQRLERLTTDLLTYARPAELHPVTFTLPEFCQGVGWGLGEPPSEVQFHLACGEDRVVLDREKLQQVVLNLVQNAMDALAGTKGDVWLKAEVSDTSLRMCVEDTGPGIPENVRKRLFEPFVTTKTRGTGLGLAIVHRLVDSMGGNIRFRDRPGGGTRVEVRLPIPTAENPALKADRSDDAQDVRIH